MTSATELSLAVRLLALGEGGLVGGMLLALFVLEDVPMFFAWFTTAATNASALCALTGLWWGAAVAAVIAAVGVAGWWNSGGGTGVKRRLRRLARRFRRVRRTAPVTGGA